MRLRPRVTLGVLLILIGGLLLLQTLDMLGVANELA